MLTDGSYRVLTLLRVYKDDERGAATATGLPYPVQNIRMYAPAGAPALRDALVGASDKLALKRAPPPPLAKLGCTVICFLLCSSRSWVAPSHAFRVCSARHALHPLTLQMLSRTCWIEFI